MNTYHITTWRSPDNPHPACFDETAHLVKVSLEDLGADVTQEDNRIDPKRINIFFNWHEWPGPEHPVSVIRRHRCIIYQGEQILRGGRQLPEWYFQSLIEADAVWDYATEHCKLLLHHKCNVQHVPPGYHPRARKIPKSEKALERIAQDKTTDVLFYGAKNIRRDFLIKLLSGLFQVKWLGDIYGAERDEEISQARLVLNVHYYLAQTLELLRISHLLQNSVAVISEESDSNPYGEGIVMASYRDLPKVVMSHLQNPYRIEQLQKKGHEAIQKYPMKEIVRTALIESELEKELAFTPPEEPVSPQSSPDAQAHHPDPADMAVTEEP